MGSREELRKTESGFVSENFRITNTKHKMLNIISLDGLCNFIAHSKSDAGNENEMVVKKIHGSKKSQSFSKKEGTKNMRQKEEQSTKEKDNLKKKESQSIFTQRQINSIKYPAKEAQKE